MLQAKCFKHAAIFAHLDKAAQLCHNASLFSINLTNAMRKVLVLHGPNLNLLGRREPAHYGTQTLEQLNRSLQTKAEINNCTLKAQQSQSESSLITAIHEAYENHTDYLIFNPAAFTHTSIALRDALLAVKLPFIEVHISRIFSRESYRHISYFSDIARGTITGFGTYGYHLALDAIVYEFNNVIE